MRGGYVHVVAMFVLVVVAGLVIFGFMMSGIEKPRQEEETGMGEVADGQPPVLIQNIGIDFDDFEFTREEISFNRLFFDYGFPIPANDLGDARRNPQPTFILPLGTEVTSLIDGVVVDVPKLYSGDFSVMVAPDKNSNWVYETEHVINVRVAKGDRVRAGQVVAEVSDFDARNYGGLGLVEIGILKGGNPPEHLCPFQYLDKSIKDEVETQILRHYKDWELFKGDITIFDEEALVSPGCLTLEAIEG